MERRLCPFLLCLVSSVLVATLTPTAVRADHKHRGWHYHARHGYHWGKHRRDHRDAYHRSYGYDGYRSYRSYSYGYDGYRPHHYGYGGYGYRPYYPSYGYDDYAPSYGYYGGGAMSFYGQWDGFSFCW